MMLWKKTQKKKNKAGIIKRIKHWLRRKFMETKKYLIIIDTIGDRVAQTAFNGAKILDVQILDGIDPEDVRQKFLSTLQVREARALYDSVFIYDLNEIAMGMDTVKQNGGDPAFRFVRPGNTRPPKMPNLAQQVQTNLGNQTLTRANDSQTVDHRQPDPAPQPVPRTKEEIVGNAVKSPRSQEFQTMDYQAKTTTNQLSPEQQRLVETMGANPMGDGANEGVNLRVNAATGHDHTLSPQHHNMVAPNQLNQDQQSILQSVGVETDMNIVQDPELQQEMMEAGHIPPEAMIDPSLAQLPSEEGVLDDAAIAELENEVKELDKGTEE